MAVVCSNDRFVYIYIYMGHGFVVVADCVTDTKVNAIRVLVKTAMIVLIPYAIRVIANRNLRFVKR